MIPVDEGKCRKASVGFCLIISGFFALSTLFKYFPLIWVPWWVTQLSYIAIIGLCFSWLLVTGDLSRIRTAFGLTSLFSLPYFLQLIHSLAAWVINREPKEYMWRGCVNIGYLMLVVLTVGFAGAVLGSRIWKYAAIGLIAGNFLIVAGVVVDRGPGNAVSEILAFVKSGFHVDNTTSRALEIHSLTFAVGAILLYLLVSRRNIRGRWVYIAASVLLCLLGWKRGIWIAVLFWTFIIWGMRLFQPEKRRRIALIVGVSMTALAFAYITVIYSGLLAKISDYLDINMMGRIQLYDWIRDEYHLSPMFAGHGTGYINEIMKAAIADGTAILNNEQSIHSDILAYYIELGFVAYLLWSLLQYVIDFRVIDRRFSPEGAEIWLAMIGYNYITYFTDNTAGYYSPLIVMFALTMAECFRDENVLPG